MREQMEPLPSILERFGLGMMLPFLSKRGAADRLCPMRILQGPTKELRAMTVHVTTKYEERFRDTDCKGSSTKA